MLLGLGISLVLIGYLPVGMCFGRDILRKILRCAYTANDLAVHVESTKESPRKCLNIAKTIEYSKNNENRCSDQQSIGTSLARNNHLAVKRNTTQVRRPRTVYVPPS